jgi:hypothetical protein
VKHELAPTTPASITHSHHHIPNRAPIGFTPVEPGSGN